MTPLRRRALPGLALMASALIALGAASAPAVASGPSVSPSAQPSASQPPSKAPVAAAAPGAVSILAYGSQGFRVQEVPHGGGDSGWTGASHALTSSQAIVVSQDVTTESDIWERKLAVP